jgi:hypothetical protein
MMAELSAEQKALLKEAQDRLFMEQVESIKHLIEWQRNNKTEDDNG